MTWCIIFKGMFFCRARLALLALIAVVNGACEIKVKDPAAADFTVSDEETREILDELAERASSPDGPTAGSATAADNGAPDGKTPGQAEQNPAAAQPAAVTKSEGETEVATGVFHFHFERKSVQWNCTERDGTLEERIKDGKAIKGGAVLEWNYTFEKRGNALVLDRSTVDGDAFSGEWQKAVGVALLTDRRFVVNHTFPKGKGEYTNSTDTLTMEATTKDEGDTYTGRYKMVNRPFSGEYKECVFEGNFVLSRNA